MIAWVLAAAFFVEASGGSDQNPGTGERPFATIGRAAAQAQPGDEVVIGPGIYRESVVLRTSGTPEHPIVFRAAVPRTVVITGLDRLQGWRRESGPDPVYSVPWPHDFVISGKKDKGTRHHMAPPPLGCAEMVIYETRRLVQVMSRGELQAGSFFVDWEADRLFAWVPWGDPNQVPVEAATRSQLWGPPPGATVDHIVLRDLRFDAAANFAQRGMVRAGDGWRVVRCVFANANGAGLQVRGKGVTLDHVIAEDNGQLGLAIQGQDITIADTILRRNNWKGFSPAGEAGGAKLVRTTGVHVTSLESYENVGPGLWFDWDNRDFEITDSRIHHNRGLKESWEGTGLFIEACPGPGLIEGNDIYGNTGGGIAIAESRGVRVLGNRLDGNGWAVALRAMEGRKGHTLGDVEIRGNVLRHWKEVAIRTSLGRWREDKNVRFDENLYDGAAPFVRWDGQFFGTLDEVRLKLNQERRGREVEVRQDVRPW
jgi:parallel beta-helix repeat protein